MLENRATHVKITAASLLALMATFLSTRTSAADAVSARLNEQTNFDIPAQPLGTALKQLAGQAGIQILFEEQVVSGLRSPEVRTHETPLQAVDALLKGTDLEFAAKGKTIAVRKKTSASSLATPGKSSSADAGVTSRDTLRLTQAGQGVPAQSVAVEDDPLRQNARSPLKLEEIVVTAQKRQERLIDVPISIATISGDELRERNITSLDELAFVAPSLSIQSDGSYQRRIVIRGISNLSGTSSLIGMYLDEASATSAPYSQLDLRTYDLDRVEVLRGPQGTLYGEGSVGGTIRFITKDPQLNSYVFNSDVAALFSQYGAPGQRIESVVNIPVIEDILGLRVAGTFDHEGGWIDQPAADQRNFNAQNLVDVRFKGLWQISPAFTANAMAVIHRNDAPPNLGEDPSGNYTQYFDQQITPGGSDNYNLYNLSLAYDFNAARVLNTTSYVDQNKRISNFGLTYVAAPPGTPDGVYDIYYPFYTTTNHILNEELRASSSGSGPWQWTLGGVYRDARYAQAGTEYFSLPGPLPSLDFPFQTNIRSASWAAFGDTSYQLVERFTVGAGLRYFHDREENNIDGQKADFHSLNPRVYVDLKLTDKANLYASAAKGFRSGGFNAQGTLPAYGPEQVWTYELGTKMSSLEGRLSAELALFFSHYTDYQVFGIPPPPALPNGLTSNAGSATIKGVDWSFSYRPADLWTLSLSGDYMRTEFTKIDVSATSHEVGDPLDLVPKYQVTVAVQRDFRLNGKTGLVRLDYEQQGQETYRDRSIGPWYFSQSDVIRMLTFNSNLDWNENLSVGFFVQNLLNERGLTDPFSIEAAATRPRPRTFGVKFSARFR